MLNLFVPFVIGDGRLLKEACVNGTSFDSHSLPLPCRNSHFCFPNFITLQMLRSAEKRCSVTSSSIPTGYSWENGNLEFPMQTPSHPTRLYMLHCSSSHSCNILRLLDTDVEQRWGAVLAGRNPLWCVSCCGKSVRRSTSLSCWSRGHRHTCSSDVSVRLKASSCGFTVFVSCVVNCSTNDAKCKKVSPTSCTAR